MAKYESLGDFGEYLRAKGGANLTEDDLLTLTASVFMTSAENPGSEKYVTNALAFILKHYGLLETNADTYKQCLQLIIRMKDDALLAQRARRLLKETITVGSILPDDKLGDVPEAQIKIRDMKKTTKTLVGK